MIAQIHPTIRQYEYELESWNRLLAFQLQECIYFKTRLSEIVNSTEDNNVLLAAEKFQEDFIAEDRVITFLKSELVSQGHLLKRDIYEDGELLGELIKKQKKLRADIRKAEKLFRHVSEEFSDYLIDQF